MKKGIQDSTSPDALRARRFCVLLWSLMVCGAVAQVKEYDLKAVYMERITRFLQWPEPENGIRPKDRFVIGILGENPFGSKLDELYAERRIKNLPIEVRQQIDLSEVGQCHLVFISRSEEGRLPSVLSAMRGKPILSVGDTAGFAEMGVLVNLVIEGERLRFEVNEQGIYQAGLDIDPLLLKVARNVSLRKGKR